jgi:hypothetical protein
MSIYTQFSLGISSTCTGAGSGAGGGGGGSGSASAAGEPTRPTMAAAVAKVASSRVVYEPVMTGVS